MAFRWVHRKEFRKSAHFALIGHAFDRVLAGKSKRLLINMPPRMGKTENGVVAYAARNFALNPQAKIMHGSYGDDLVAENSQRIMNILKTEAFMENFPDTRLKPKQQAKKLWKTTAEGSFRAVSTQAGVTGFECGGDGDPLDGALIIDDPQKANQMHNASYRESTLNVVSQMISTRLNHEDTPVIVIQQRLHAEDCSAFLMNGGTGDVWDVLCLQAISETGRPPEHYQNYSHANVLDYRVPVGAIWPARRSLEGLLKIRDAKESTNENEPAGKRVFMGQYQQNPSGSDLAMYEKDDFTTFSEADIPPTLSTGWLRIDTAQKGSASSDFHGAVLFGSCPRMPENIFCLDANQKRCDFPELIDWLIELIKHYKKQETQSFGFTRIMIEDANIGAALSASLQVRLKKEKLACTVSLTDKYKNKFDRAMEALPYHQQHRIWYPAQANRFSVSPVIDGVKALKDEYNTFNEQDTHANDDLLDCVNWEISYRWGELSKKSAFAFAGIVKTR